MIDKILTTLFPKTVIQIQQRGIDEYSRVSDGELLVNAMQGISFYVRGDTDKQGWHKLYKFEPKDMGRHRTLLVGPNQPPQRVYWKDGTQVVDQTNQSSEEGKK